MKYIFTLILSLVVAVPLASAQVTVYDAGGGAGSKSVFIESDPSGANFAFEGPAHTLVVEGKTPARIVGIDADIATVHFGDMQDCLAPKPQMRELGQPVHFYGRYNCPRPPTSEPKMTSAGVKLSAHQAEVLPGASMKFTLAIHNYGTDILEGAIASIDYDPSLLRLTAIHQGGKLATPGTAQWNIPDVKPGETWTTIFSARSSRNLPDTAVISVNGRVTGSSLVASAQTVSTVAIGVPVMPAAGSAAQSMVILGILMQLALGAAYVHRKISLV
ncbi:MAG: hypothetical protein QF755_04065 [Candidatus Peribacteraceae bacterium]|jgi:hypothetical protein|nr:hypothetical protein [Candidatus Peribacteraceae bacterium]HCI03590.1 hypothetical protein [Candidatus Peribacteria bacterium]|tara:strand:- start:796 stop:1617 length:822 start_codon:yes stop_codon:yes gene_type:complete